MTLYQSIGEHLKEAMKTGDAFRRDTLRLLQSALKNSAIEKRTDPAELSDTEVEEVAKRLVKQRKDSVEQFRAGNREDLALQEEKEMKLLETYLPEGMSEEELGVLVTEVLAECGIVSRNQMGQAMGMVMKKVAGRASGDDVRRLVESKLS